MTAWEQRKLGEFSKKRTTKNADGTLSETFTNSAEQGVISQLDYFDHDITNDANISGYYVVQPDDFVYNPRISATAPCGPINRNRLDRAGVMSPLYTVFSVDASVDKTYLEHYFKTSRWHDFMFLEGNSGARSDRFSISDATFFEMPIWCPEISEQKAMAKQLETTDHLITLHQRKCQYRSLYGYLSWEQRKLGGLFFESNERSSSMEILSVSVAKGIYPASESNRDTNPGASLANYKVVHKGDVVYNSMRMWQGAVGSSDYDGIVSPAYVVARPVIELDSTCFGYLLKRPEMLYKYLCDSQGNSKDTQTLKYNRFADIEVTMPVNLEEQRVISACLGRVDTLITLHQ